MKASNETAAVVFLLLLILAIVMPFAYIWAWNTLFGSILLIPTNFYTWLATLILSGMLTIRKAK